MFIKENDSTCWEMFSQLVGKETIDFLSLDYLSIECADKDVLNNLIFFSKNYFELNTSKRLDALELKNNKLILPNGQESIAPRFYIAFNGNNYNQKYYLHFPKENAMWGICLVMEPLFQKHLKSNNNDYRLFRCDWKLNFFEKTKVENLYSFYNRQLKRELEMNTNRLELSCEDYQVNSFGLKPSPKFRSLEYIQSGDFGETGTIYFSPKYKRLPLTRVYSHDWSKSFSLELEFKGVQLMERKFPKLESFDIHSFLISGIGELINDINNLNIKPYSTDCFLCYVMNSKLPFLSSLHGSLISLNSEKILKEYLLLPKTDLLIGKKIKTRYYFSSIFVSDSFQALLFVLFLSCKNNEQKKFIIDEKKCFETLKMLDSPYNKKLFRDSIESLEKSVLKSSSYKKHFPILLNLKIKKQGNELFYSFDVNLKTIEKISFQANWEARELVYENSLKKGSKLYLYPIGICFLESFQKDVFFPLSLPKQSLSKKKFVDLFFYLFEKHSMNLSFSEIKAGIFKRRELKTGSFSIFFANNKISE